MDRYSAVFVKTLTGIIRTGFLCALYSVIKLISFGAMFCSDGKLVILNIKIN